MAAVDCGINAIGYPDESTADHAQRRGAGDGFHGDVLQPGRGCPVSLSSGQGR